MPRRGSGQQLSAKHQYAHLGVTQDTCRQFGWKPVDIRILQMLSKTGATRQGAALQATGELGPITLKQEDEEHLRIGGCVQGTPPFRGYHCFQIREPGRQPALLPQRLSDFSAFGQHATDTHRPIADFSDLQDLGTKLGMALCLQPVMNCGERVNSHVLEIAAISVHLPPRA